MAYEVQDFDREVIEQSRGMPVVVDFWAPWCGPCKMLGPVIEKLAAEANGQWRLVKVNTEERQDLAMRFSISSIPAVKLFRDGQEVDEFLGFLPENDIRRWLERHLPSPARARLEKAAERIDDGDLAGARLLLEEALTEEPNLPAALLLLAETRLSDDPAASMAVLDRIAPEADERAHAEALRVLAQAALRDAATLPEDSIKPQLVAALNAVKHRDWDSALGAVTEVLERRRAYADGLAADIGKAIFRYLGIRHPITDRHYRRFSSALNA